MADRYLVFARDAMLDSPSALPHFLGAAKIGAQMRDRGAVLQVWESGVGGSAAGVGVQWAHVVTVIALIIYQQHAK